MFDLSGRVAVVTGGGHGVGAAICEALAAQGASVGVVDLDGSRAEAVASTLRAAGAAAAPFTADVTDELSVGAVRHEVAATLGPVDILVNNAGRAPSTLRSPPFLDTEASIWEPFVDVNLYGVLRCTHALVPQMVARGWGRVVTIVSEAGRVGERGATVYAATKAGAAGFSRSLAKEIGRSGVTCNCLSLGWIDAPSTRLAPADVDRVLRAYPMGRGGRPDDVAAAVVWLASEEAGWVTGQTISISGGYVTT